MAFDTPPKDFKKAIKKNWEDWPVRPDYYDWTQASSPPIFGDWVPKSNKKKVASCGQPQMKEGSISFLDMINLMKENV